MSDLIGAERLGPVLRLKLENPPANLLSLTVMGALQAELEAAGDDKSVRVVVIAEIDGVATAAGCQLVASCDLAIASDQSRFGVNGIDVGLFCSTPAVALTRAISRKRAMEMLLTGEMIDAETALAFGLVNRVVPRESLSDAVRELADRIAAKSPTALRLGKEAVRTQAGMGLADAYEHTSRVMIENMLAPDAEEGITAFFEKREPVWRET